MNTPTHTDVFEITLSQKGIGYMLKTFNLVRWVFLFGALGAGAYIYLHVARFVQYGEYGLGTGWVNYVMFRLMPWVGSVAILLNMVQFTAYMVFTRRCYRAIELRQSELFNESFKWLLRNTRMAVFVVLLNLLMALFCIWEHIKTVSEQVPQV